MSYHRWHDTEEAWVGSSHVSGTGSISCRSITDEDAREAQERRQPIGFFASAPIALEEWGEAEWTARDLL